MLPPCLPALLARPSGRCHLPSTVTDLPHHLTTALAGRYTIERQLGEGGMPTVYLARDVKHDRDVAIKVLRPELAAALGVPRESPVPVSRSPPASVTASAMPKSVRKASPS